MYSRKLPVRILHGSYNGVHSQSLRATGIPRVVITGAFKEEIVRVNMTLLSISLVRVDLKELCQELHDKHSFLSCTLIRDLRI